MYYSNFGPATGTLRGRDVPRSIVVFGAPGSYMPVGQADSLEPDRGGNAEFRMEVGGKLLEGRWLLIAREFARAHDDGR